jgi:peptidoglycan/LPS O-acetylase OafA/YrhL
VAAVDIMRGVAICGVLVIHSSFVGRFDSETLAVQAALMRLFDWAVAAFFFSSGLMHDSAAAFGTVFRRRLLSLLVPFFFYNLVYNLCFAGISATGLAGHSGLGLNVGSLATIFFESPAFQLYYLPYLFLVSVGVSGLNGIGGCKQRGMYLSLLALALAFYVVRGYPVKSHGPAMENLPLYLASFLIGVLNRPILLEPLSRPWLLASALAVTLALLSFSWFHALDLLVPPLLVAVAGAVRGIRESRLLPLIGGMSGSIYVWHTPVMLPLITRTLARCGLPSMINFFGSMVLTLAACVLLRQGMDLIFERGFKRRCPRYITL